MNEEKHRHYKYNSLTNVIFRINFPKIELKADDPPLELINDLKEKFPNHKPIKGQSVELEIKDFKHTTRQEDIFSLEFIDEQNETRLVVSPDSLAFEHLKYKGFKNFYSNIKFIIEKFGETFPIEKINQLGLRYINQIDIKPPKNPFNWDNLIKSELTCVSDNFVEDNNKLSRSLQFLEMNEGDYRIRFQFGFYNSEYPNPISKKEFVLDYDCVTIDEISLNDIPPTTKRFHESIYNLFEMSIEDGLREMMSDEDQ